MKNKKLIILIASIGLFLMAFLFIPHKPAKANCGSLKNWFCQDGSYCLSNTDKSNCDGSC